VRADSGKYVTRDGKVPRAQESSLSKLPNEGHADDLYSDAVHACSEFSGECRIGPTNWFLPRRGGRGFFPVSVLRFTLALERRCE
jgi:hypothetical protein